MRFSPDGTTLATAHREGIRFWSSADGHLQAAGLAGETRSLAFARDGKSLAGADDRRRRVRLGCKHGPSSRTLLGSRPAPALGAAGRSRPGFDDGDDIPPLREKRSRQGRFAFRRRLNASQNQDRPRVATVVKISPYQIRKPLEQRGCASHIKIGGFSFGCQTSPTVVKRLS